MGGCNDNLKCCKNAKHCHLKLIAFLLAGNGSWSQALSSWLCQMLHMQSGSQPQNPQWTRGTGTFNWRGGHRGLFLLKLCINLAPMIAKIVDCGLIETQFGDFKTSKMLTSRAPWSGGSEHARRPGGPGSNLAYSSFDFFRIIMLDDCGNLFSEEKRWSRKRSKKREEDDVISNQDRSGVCSVIFCNLIMLLY